VARGEAEAGLIGAVQEGTIYHDPLLLEARNGGRSEIAVLFEVSDGISVFEDDQGQTFATLDDAKAAASVLAAELAADPGRYRGFEIYVTDEDGNDVARVPIEG
jgi:hypothetical protein